MLKSALKVLLFIAIMFLVLEQSYRYMAAGTTAFHPVRFNSLNILPRTGLVELSSYPDVYYQLKPNQDSWFSGIPFQTNSAGLADREYSLQKPEGTFRVVVIGSSWTMATGVPQQEAYHAVLEAELNKLYPDKNFEFINFGVEMYGLRELVGTLRHRALEWDPDLVLVTVTAYTNALLWEEPRADQQLPKQFNPFFSSYFLRAMDWLLKTGFISRTLPERPTVQDPARNEAQIVRAMTEMAALTGKADVPLALMWLSFAKPGQGLEDKIELYSELLGFSYFKTYTAIAAPESVVKLRSVRPMDKHPNSETHKMIADQLLLDLKANALLPGVK